MGRQIDLFSLPSGNRRTKTGQTGEPLHFRELPKAASPDKLLIIYTSFSISIFLRGDFDDAQATAVSGSFE